MANKKVTKNNKKDEKKFITTKVKKDNSIEVSVNKSPAKTTSGKILVWVISIFTIGVPVLGLIFTILYLCGVIG